MTFNLLYQEKEVQIFIASYITMETLVFKENYSAKEKVEEGGERIHNRSPDRYMCVNRLSSPYSV